MIRLVIPAASPSLNETQRMHWAVRRKLKKRWSLLVAVAVAGQPRATGKRRLTIERHGKRALDADNIAGGAKECVIDVLRAFHMLVDDDDRHMELVCKNAKLANGQEPCTVILLEDL